MKKILFSLGLVGILVGSVSRVEATPYRDIDTVNQNLNSTVTSYSGDLNIATSDGGILDITGFNPANETITSAYALFLIFNVLNGNQSEMRIDLDANAFIANTSLPLGWSLWGDSVAGQALLNLDATGEVTYTVTRTSGRFKLVSAGLFVEAGPRAAVPDSGLTLSLFGLGIMAIGFIRRKLA